MRRKNTGFGRSNRKRIVSVSLSPSFEFWRNWHRVFSALTAPNPHPVCHLAVSFFFQFILPCFLLLLCLECVNTLLAQPLCLQTFSLWPSMQQQKSEFLNIIFQQHQSLYFSSDSNLTVKPNENVQSLRVSSM